MRWVNRC